MDEHFKNEPRKSIQSLPQSIPSLIGLKRNLTSSWIESICCIIKELPSKKTVGDPMVRNQIIDKLESPGYDDEVDAAFSKIQVIDELASLNALLSQLALQRRQALNDYLDLKGNIRVFCRIRPFLRDASHIYEQSVITSDSSNVFLRFADTKSKQYSFDKVFQPNSTQEEVFQEIEPVIKSSLDGYNVCIFAYGQTGTGKTYTMEGTPEDPGVVPRGLQALFEQAAESNYKFLFMFSMLEIYMGNLRDLLVLRSRKAKFQKSPRIQTNPEGDVEIENLVTVKVSDFEQVKRFYELGTRFRSTASTMANSTSSRSHCLIRISLSSSGASERRREANKLWLVDLGGSERLLKTQASGRRLQEGKAINLSLSALGDVISALQSKKPHVPYRNSKLTQVLRDSLGSDSKTLMLVHVSPKEHDLCETICSLGFATRARSIHLENEEPAEMRARKELLMAELEQKVAQLEGECQDVIRDVKKLDEKLKYLSRPQPQIDSHFNISCLSIEELQSSRSMNMQNSNSSLEASASLPRFMRATICSQQKTGLNNHTYLNTRKKPPLHSKRRSSSVCAESVMSPEKCVAWQSDCSSECSIPATSYVNWRQSEKDGTAHSLGDSESEIKQVILPEQEKSPGSQMTSPDLTSPDRHIEEPENVFYFSSGKFELFLQSLKLAWMSALLGLGIHSLGLGNDFFQGLLF
ncbi:kinesin-like protein KIN-14B isoform X2 [Typha angustifolia]|uniref:kinesin-like protein KIN-14B isoform X2 n=1 Tax=Typha angustifolia TaxID=59011 RepID=UPI003C2DD258